MNELISKSQKKREAHALRDLGIVLIEQSNQTLNELPLTEHLRKAIIDAKTIKSHGAKRRQAQLIGKLIRATDYEAIVDAFEKMKEDDNASTADFHQIELWRTRLMQEGKTALTEFIDQYHPKDMQQLKHSIKKALEDEQKQKNTGASTQLFRYLRAIMQ